MTDTTTPSELEERIAAVRRNIRELIGQVTATRGDAAAENAENLLPGQIPEQYRLLAALLKERTAQKPLG
jgi:hypothetical protein